MGNTGWNATSGGSHQGQGTGEDAMSSWEGSIHTFDPDPRGVCQGGWINAKGFWVPCRSTQRSSVLHDDPESDFREMHDHGGGDCMCFELDSRGYYGAMKDYIESRRNR
jgi:hypothetical protein